MKRWWTFALVAGGVVWIGANTLRAASDSQETPSGKAQEPAATDQSSQPQSLAPLAQQFLEAAKARLHEQKETAAQQKAQQERAKLRDHAQHLAIQMAQEKTKQEAAKAREAQRQLQLARERQLKYLYTKATEFSRQGAYDEAIEIFQQMALIDPTHSLVKAGQRLMAQAEVKRFEQRARASAKLPPGTQGAVVSDLERLLAEKRMELETVLKYAKQAVQDQHYDLAIELLQRVLVQDPDHREALQLLKQAQTERLNTEKEQLTRQVEIDEKQMMNEVLKAELLPPKPAAKTLPPSSRTTASSDELESHLLARLQEPISFDFKDVAFEDVLDFLANAASVSIIPSPRIDLKQQRVSFKVEHLPMGLALKHLVHNQGLALQVDEDVILIASPEEFASEPMDTRVFFLRSGLGPFALQTSAVESNPSLDMKTFKDLVAQAIAQPPGSKLVTDERSGSIVITNTPENLKRVEQLLSQLDTTPVQVLIEARFVELTTTDLSQIGLESVLTGNAALTKEAQSDRTRSPGNQIAKGGGFKFPALSRESEALNITLQGVMTGTQFETALHLLQESKKSKTLSAPRITALNNQPASIKVVEEFRYPTRYEVSRIQFDINGDGDFDDAGETQFVNVPKDFQKRDVGILLNVTPSVGKDLQTITLVLMPEVSQFSQFRDLGGDVTVPEFTSSQLTTSVVIHDGQTVVLGGLMKDSTSYQLTKVPVLGDLPVLGGLFRQREESKSQKTLLIFVTARILAPRGPTT